GTGLPHGEKPLRWSVLDNGLKLQEFCPAGLVPFRRQCGGSFVQGLEFGEPGGEMVPKAMRARSIAERTEVGILPWFGFDALFARLVKLEHEIAGGLFERFLALAGTGCQLRGPLRRGRPMIDLREVATLPNARAKAFSFRPALGILDRLYAGVDVDGDERLSF